MPSAAGVDVGVGVGVGSAHHGRGVGVGVGGGGGGSPPSGSKVITHSHLAFSVMSISVTLSVAKFHFLPLLYQPRNLYVSFFGSAGWETLSFSMTSCGGGTGCPPSASNLTPVLYMEYTM